jgi:hypothetical protein
MNDTTLAARRRELVERCAEQRVGLAYELKALQRPAALVLPPAAAQLLSRVLANRRLAYGAAGAALALALVRPRRMQHLARLAASSWRIAREGLALAARYRH